MVDMEENIKGILQKYKVCNGNLLETPASVLVLVHLVSTNGTFSWMDMIKNKKRFLCSKFLYIHKVA